MCFFSRLFLLFLSLIHIYKYKMFAFVVLEYVQMVVVVVVVLSLCGSISPGKERQTERERGGFRIGTRFWYIIIFIYYYYLWWICFFFPFFCRRIEFIENEICVHNKTGYKLNCKWIFCTKWKMNNGKFADLSHQSVEIPCMMLSVSQIERMKFYWRIFQRMHMFAVIRRQKRNWNIPSVESDGMLQAHSAERI